MALFVLPTLRKLVPSYTLHHSQQDDVSNPKPPRAPKSTSTSGRTCTTMREALDRTPFRQLKYKLAEQARARHLSQPVAVMSNRARSQRN